MREFKSLQPIGLPTLFKAEIHGEMPFVDIEESKKRITISYIFPGFYISPAKQDVEGERIPFEQINIAQTGFHTESGRPLLPSLGRYVQIPFNCEYKVTVKKGEPVQFDDVFVVPAQEMLTDDAEEKPALEYDREFYSKDKFYPSDVVEVTGPFRIDGYNALLVHVKPLQYNPAKKKLVGYGNIDVTIDVSPKEGELSVHAFSSSELDREAFGNLFLNPKRKIDERLEIKRSGRAEVLYTQGPEFLVIYHQTFEDAAEALAQWKNMRGLCTEIVPLGSVGNTVDEIKEYIRERRGSLFSGLRYVLLFGDVDMIPSETIVDNITDYYYSTPTDPQGPNYIVLPWLSIGRIPVQNADEGMQVVDQIIAYEENPPCDPEYYRRMAFAAYFQDWNGDNVADRKYIKTMEEIREHMITLGYDVERIYVSDSTNPEYYMDGVPVPADVKNAIVDGDIATGMIISTTAEGQLITGHRDHGGPQGWSHPSFNNGHLETITSDYPSIFYSLNCRTGQFDLPAPTECFAEKILRIKGGAPSIIAATRGSGTWRNDSLMKAQFDAMWPGVLPTYPDSTASYSVKYCRLGDILNYAKVYLLTTSTNAAGIKDHLEIYHVIGDPTLQLWRSIPRVVSVQARARWDDVYIRRKPYRIPGWYYLHITLSACPKGSVITIWYEGKLRKRIEPSSTHIEVSLRDILLAKPPSSRREVLVCFSAPGCRFRQTRVIV